MDRPCGNHCNNPRCDRIRCLGPLSVQREMYRGAVMAFPDDQGDPQCRLVLERIAPYAQIPDDLPPPTAAWLMCNPSDASHLIDDPTAGRVVHHSNRAGRPRSLVGNVWGWRTPYPRDLWPAVADGRYTDAMAAANLDALCMIAAQADLHIVAFGAAPMRDHPIAVHRALEVFSNYGKHPLYCLGTTGDGQPLHPLARGKHAVRNDAQLRPWTSWRWGPNERSWDDVFSDKVRCAAGWVDK
jgi:hypothetical protein